MQDLNLQNLDTLLEIWENTPKDNRANLQTHILEYLNLCPETLTYKIRNKKLWSYLYWVFDDYVVPECDNIVTEIIHQQFKFIGQACRKSLDYLWEGAIEDGEVETDDWNDFMENNVDGAIANIIDATPDDRYYSKFFGEHDIMTAVIACIQEFSWSGYTNPGEVFRQGLNSILDNIN